jgi:uncharacterized protein YjiS (DUF1127 family)
MSLLNWIAAVGHAIAQWHRRNRAYHELMALDDRTLADIGISRSEIPRIVWAQYGGQREQSVKPARASLGGHGAFASPR